MTSVLIRGGGNLDTDNYREKTMYRHMEKTAIYKLRREASTETSPADTLLLDF